MRFFSSFSSAQSSSAASQAAQGASNSSSSIQLIENNLEGGIVCSPQQGSEKELFNEVQTQIQNLLEKQKNAQALVQRFQDQLRDLNVRIGKMQKNANDLQPKILACKRGKAGRTKKSNLQGQLTNFETLLKSLKSQSKTLSQQIKKLESKISSRQSQISALTVEKNILSGMELI